MSDKDFVCPLGHDHQRMIQETHDAVLMLVAEGKAYRAKVDDHHKTLFGNGKPGIVEDMQFVKMARKVFWIIVGATAPILLGGVFAGVVWLIVHMNSAK